MWTLPVLSAGSLITIRYSFKFWVVLVKILFLAVVVLVLDVLEEGATCCFLLTIAETLSVQNDLENDGFQKGGGSGSKTKDTALSKQTNVF
jgi:hypothetical protein